jgi:hypothetical protein
MIYLYYLYDVFYITWILFAKRRKCSSEQASLIDVQFIKEKI